MTRYANGRRFEYKVAHVLETNGYLVVRAAGSKGKADLVALKPTQVLLVQCKTDGYMAPAEWNEVYQSAVSVAAVPLLAHRPAPGVVVFWRLLGEKANRKSQYEVWTPDELGEAPC